MKRALAAVAIMAMTGAAFADLPTAKQQELAAAGISSWAPGQNQGQTASAEIASPIRIPGATRDTATMQYDDGTISALPTVFGQVYGNKFSQGMGGAALSTITLNSFSFYFAEDSTADTGLFFQAAAPGTSPGMIAPQVSLDISGLVNAGSSFSMLTTINVIPQTALGTTGMFSNTFYLGGWCLNANTTVPVDNETLGLSTNGPRQQGYTASSGGSGTSVAMAPQAFNVVLRANVTSPAAVPVELMSFDAQ